MLQYKEKIEKDRIAKNVIVGECAGSHSVGRPEKRWTDTVNECFKKVFPSKARKEDGL